MGVFYVPTGLVRPKVIALLQAYGPTDAVANVVGVHDQTIRSIYEREHPHVTVRVADKIEAAYEKISRGGNHHEIKA